MARYIIRRLSTSILLLVLVSMMVFVMLRTLPGDPIAAIYAGTLGGVSPTALAALREEFGVNRPIPDQYVRWVEGIVHGNFGKSYYSEYPVTKLVEYRIWPTVELTLVALFIALAIAMPIGLAAALWPRSWIDRAGGVFVTAGVALPSFVLGIGLILVFALWLHILPAQGYASLTGHPLKNLKVIILPALTLGIVASAPIARFLRAGILEAIAAPYILTAQGKGLRWHQVVLRHAFPNALVPTITFVGTVIGHMLAGVVIIEYVFGWPGLGSLAVESVTQRDYPVLQAAVLLLAGFYLLTNLVVDLLYGVIDPRLRISRQEA